MLIMGLDTALQRCSVAIVRDARVLADETVPMARGHAEHLAPMVGTALDRAGVCVSELDRVGVVVGPGGFTGVRVGLSFARGLGVGTQIDVLGVTSLAALAAGNTKAGAGVLRACVIDARRGQVYAGLYGARDDQSSAETLVAPFIETPAIALKILAQEAAALAPGVPVHVVGSGAYLLCALPADWTVDPEEGAEIDAKQVAYLVGAASAPTAPPAPLYLRAPDAKPGRPGVFALSAQT